MPEARPTSIHPVETPLAWQTVLASLWLTGSLSWLSLAGWRLWRFQRQLAYTTLAPPEIQTQARQLAGRLGLTRSPAVWLVPAPVSPMLWAFLGKPRLLVPHRLWNGLAEAERESLLAHELIHFQRGDHCVRVLEIVVMALYWWHPVVWWARRELREAEEQCCDRGVLTLLPVSAPAYAKTLVETVDFLSQARPALPVVASGMGQAHYLRRRLTMIMRGTTGGQVLNWPCFLILLGLGVVLLPLWPTWAQNPATPPTAEELAEVADEPINFVPVAPMEPQPPATTPTSASNMERPRPSLRQQAIRDEIELLKAQLDVKRADAEEVEIRIAVAKRKLERVNALAARGAISNEERENAQDEVAVLAAQLAPKRALIREAEIRLRQASGRLERSTGRRRTW
jgi:beta-lactamase regulating signal transducer with metallopeptidase domain